MSNPNPPASPASTPRWLVWLGVLFFAGYGIFIYQHFSIVAAGSDASGYLNSARLIASGRLQTDLRIPQEFGEAGALNRMHYFPLGFWPFPDDPKITPTYPSGVPLHFALAGKLVDWITGPRLVGLFAALGAVGWCYAVARELRVDARLAAAGAIALGVCPLFLIQAFQPMSDVLATTWCLAAVWAGLRARRTIGWAVACGAAFAIAVLVRPTNLMLLPALLVICGLDWRRLALAVVGGLPGAVWLAIYNHTLFGSAFRSGYGDFSFGFAWSWGPPTAWHFAKWLTLTLPAPLLLLPVAAIAHAATRSRLLLALALWFAAFVGLYAFYEVSHTTWWNLRFILPALPPLILGGLIGLEAIARGFNTLRAEQIRHAAAIAIAVWALGLSIFWNRHFAITETNNGTKVFAKACAAARDRFPPGTLVVTFEFSGAFYYYTDFGILRWEQVSPAEFARYAALAQKAGRTVAAVEFKWNEQAALREHCPGNWERVDTVGDAVLWRLSPGTTGAGAH